MIKQSIGRILAITVVTFASAEVFEAFAKAFFQKPEFNIDYNIDDATNAIMFLGAVFGFWLTYTGRLARMFRKV